MIDFCCRLSPRDTLSGYGKDMLFFGKVPGLLGRLHRSATVMKILCLWNCRAIYPGQVFHLGYLNLPRADTTSPYPCTHLLIAMSEARVCT